MTEDYEFDTEAATLESEFYRDHATTVDDLGLQFDQEVY